ELEIEEMTGPMTPFDHRPDARLGEALRAALDSGDQAAFVARVLAAAARPARTVDVLAAWARRGLVAAMAAAAVAGLLHGRRGGPDAMVNYLDDHLRLSDAQKDSVRAILARHRPEMEALWREVHPRFDSIRTVIRGEISGQLTPAQRDEYVRLLAEQEHQRQRQDSANANRDGGKR